MTPQAWTAAEPVCACAEFYTSHHPECPVLAALTEKDAALARLTAENERLKDELGTIQGAYQLAANGRDRAESALTAERQKVEALREWLTQRKPLDYGYERTLAEMDALGLTGTEPAKETT